MPLGCKDTRHAPASAPAASGSSTQPSSRHGTKIPQAPSVKWQEKLSGHRLTKQISTDCDKNRAVCDLLGKGQCGSQEGTPCPPTPGALPQEPPARQQLEPSSLWGPQQPLGTPAKSPQEGHQWGRGTSDWLEGREGEGLVLAGVPGCLGDRRGDKQGHSRAHGCCLQEAGGLSEAGRGGCELRSRWL